MTSEGRAYIVAISKTKPTLLNGSLLPVEVEKRLMHEDIVMFRGGKLDGGGVYLKWTYPKSSHRGRGKSTSSEKNANEKDKKVTHFDREVFPERSPCQVEEDRTIIAGSKARISWAPVVEEIPEPQKPFCLMSSLECGANSPLNVGGVGSLSKESNETVCGENTLSKKGSSGDNTQFKETSCGADFLSKETEVSANSTDPADCANIMCMETSRAMNTLSREAGIKAKSLSEVIAGESGPLSDEIISGAKSVSGEVATSEINPLSKENVDKVTTPSKEAVKVINTLSKESATKTNFLAKGESTEIKDRPVEDADEVNSPADVVSNEAVFPSSALITGGISSIVTVSDFEGAYCL